MQTSPDFLSMSDDEISNMVTPAPGTAEQFSETVEVVQQEEPQEEIVEVVVTEEVTEVQELKDKAAEKIAADQKILATPDDKFDKPIDTPKPDQKPVIEEAVKKPAEEEVPKVVEEAVAPQLTNDQKAAALDSLMTFKANGKEIKLNSPDEVLKLVQMGANYTKKMQELQPKLRLLKMLDNNKLTDANQLSYLIDLHQRKPEAIQKLLADSNFDPMTADADKAAQYKPGAHQVSDAEVQFEQVLQEVEASETGKELIGEVARQWDEGSRRALFQDPKLLTLLNTQKANGLYGLVTTEMERRKVLGEFQGVPFLIAYQQVGEALNAEGKLKPATRPEVPAISVIEPPKREPAAVRVVTPPVKVVNSDKAKAASAPKQNAATVKTVPDFLNMPDAEFLKQFDGRL